MSLLIYEAPGGAVILRAQAVIQMTTNRCETLRIAALAARTGRTYDALRSLVSYTTLANRLGSSQVPGSLASWSHPKSSQRARGHVAAAPSPHCATRAGNHNFNTYS